MVGLEIEPFVPGSLVGTFSVFELDGEVPAGVFPQSQAPIFQMEIIAEDEDTAYFDQNNNGQRDPGETRFLRFNDGSGAFSESSTEPGPTMPPGRYCLKFNNRLRRRDNFSDPRYCFFSSSGENDSIELRALSAPCVSQFPQVAVGSTARSTGDSSQGSADALEITTLFSIDNPTNQIVGAMLEFFDPEGNTAEVTIDGVTSSVFEFDVPAYGGVTRQLVPDTAIRTLWGRGSGPNLTFALTYLTTQRGTSPAGADDRVLGEAGLVAGPPGFTHVLNVRKDSSGLDNAFAAVNPVPVPAKIELTLRDSNNAVVKTGSLELAALNQTAVFVFDFLGLTLDDVLTTQGDGVRTFDGSLTMRSDNAISIVTLSTQNGFQQSSLQAGTLRISN